MPTYNIPSSQAITLNLPQPAVGGAVAWSMSPTVGTLTPSNDGQSALYTPGSEVLPLTKAVINTAQTLSLTGTAASSGGVAVYAGTITGGAANAFAGFVFVVSGMDQSVNNGTFICTASTAIALTLSNGSAVSETSSGTPTAVSAITHTGYIGTITGGASNALNGDGVTVAGFTNAGNNGPFTIIASSTTNFGVVNSSGVTESHVATATLTSGATSTTVTAVITGNTPGWQPGARHNVGDQIIDGNGHIQQVTAATKRFETVYTPEALSIPQGGDAAYFAGEAARKAAGNYTDPVGLATVLNQGDGDINGDWPAGATQPGGAVGYNGYVSKGNTIGAVPTTAAPVTFVAGGFSAGHNAGGQDNGPAGITSSNVYGFYDASGNLHLVGTTNNSSFFQIATYSEIGANGLISYFDGAGIEHTGWLIMQGSQFFNDNAVAVPAFSTSGGSVTDGDLTWTDEGAESSLATYHATLNLGSNPAPLGYYVVLG